MKKNILFILLFIMSSCCSLFSALHEERKDCMDSALKEACCTQDAENFRLFLEEHQRSLSPVAFAQWINGTDRGNDTALSLLMYETLHDNQKAFEKLYVLISFNPASTKHAFELLLGYAYTFSEDVYKIQLITNLFNILKNLGQDFNILLHRETALNRIMRTLVLNECHNISNTLVILEALLKNGADVTITMPKSRCNPSGLSAIDDAQQMLQSENHLSVTERRRLMLAEALFRKYKEHTVS